MGDAGPHDPLGGAVDALETRTLLPVPVCYHTRFLRYILNSLGVVRKPHKFCGNLGPRPPSDWSMADPRNRLLRHVCHHKISSNRFGVSIGFQKLATLGPRPLG